MPGVRVMTLLALRRFPLRALAAFVAAAGLLPASLSAASPRVGGDVVLVSAEEPETLDPHKAAAGPAGHLLRYVGDTLVTRDLQGNYTSGLARGWTVSRDGLAWTFLLKEGVRFHDGTPLTAQAVEFTVRRALAPETGSPIAAMIFGPVASVQAVTPHTVVIRLKEPFAPFIDNLTVPQAMIVSPQAVQQLGDRFGRGPVGTGPFRVQQWRSGDRLILARNADYRWGPAFVRAGPASLDRLVVRFMPEPAAQVAAFERGEIHIYWPAALAPAEARRLQETGRYQILTVLSKGVGLFLEFNTTRDPFRDPRVRRALNYAIEKRSILQIALEGFGAPAHGPLSPSLWGYWEGVASYAPGYNPAEARRLLAEAGWQPGPDGILHKDGRPFEFTLLRAPIETWDRSAQIIQAQLRAFGIQMEMQTLEFGTLLSQLRAGDHQATLMGYTYPSPDIVHLRFHSSNVGTGLASTHHRDAALDRLLEASRTETNLSRRAALYHEIQRMVVDLALWVPLWTNATIMVVQPGVVGVRAHPDGFVVLNDAHLR